MASQLHVSSSSLLSHRLEPHQSRPDDILIATPTLTSTCPFVGYDLDSVLGFYHELRDSSVNVLASGVDCDSLQRHVEHFVQGLGQHRHPLGQVSVFS